MTEDEFADLIAQVAGVPYEVEALPRRHGLAARGLSLADRLDEDLGLDDEARVELVVALRELCGDVDEQVVRAWRTARTVGDLWAALDRAGLTASPAPADE